MWAIAAAPVVLGMNMHCYDCIRKIKEAIGNMYGVEKVCVSPEQGVVVVHGTANAYALRRRIRRRMRRSVTIFSHGSPPYYNFPETTHCGTLQPPPPPPPPPPGCPYPAGGCGAGCADPEPYGYVQRGTAPTCSIL